MKADRDYRVASVDYLRTAVASSRRISRKRQPLALTSAPGLQGNTSGSTLSSELAARSPLGLGVSGMVERPLAAARSCGLNGIQ